jgi:hypothetical protein
MAILPASQSPNCVRASRPSFSITRDKAERIGEGEAVGLDEDGSELGVRLVVFGASRDRTHSISALSPATSAWRALYLQAQIRESSSWLIHAALAPRRSPERLVQLPDTAPSVLIEYLLPKRRALNDLLDLQSGC